MNLAAGVLNLIEIDIHVLVTTNFSSLERRRMYVK
jgi:hypothetical protein